jgi:hypothetical protein
MRPADNTREDAADAKSDSDINDLTDKSAEPAGRESAKINMTCTGVTRARIEASARKSGRTLSREAEYLIERCFVLDDTFAQIGQTAEQLKQQSLDAAFWRHGYKPIRTHERNAVYRIYVPHDYPGFETWAPARPGEFGPPIEPPSFSQEELVERDAAIEAAQQKQTELRAVEAKIKAQRKALDDMEAENQAAMRQIRRTLSDKLSS